MLEEALAADPNLARRVLMPLAGTVFPIVGSGPNENHFVKYDSTDQLVAATAFEDSSGKVGIGTPTPNNRLEVAGTTFNRITASVSADVQTGYQWKKTGANATDWEGYVPAGSTALRFYNAGGADRVTFLTDGKVGIGTTTPKRPLHVNGGDAVVHEGGGFGFMEGTKDDATTILYRTGGSDPDSKDITRLRNWNVGQSNPPVYTILELRAPKVPSGDPTREATLSLVRVDTNDANLDYLDLYNVRTNESGPPAVDSKTMGIRVARVGAGDFSDFVIDQYTFNVGVDNVFMHFDHGKNIVIAPTAGNVGIGINVPKFKLHTSGAAVALGAPASEPASGDLNSSNLTFWIDENASPKKLMFKVKLSTGNVVTASLNLA